MAVTSQELIALSDRLTISASRSEAIQRFRLKDGTFGTSISDADVVTWLGSNYPRGQAHPTLTGLVVDEYEIEYVDHALNERHVAIKYRDLSIGVTNTVPWQRAPIIQGSSREYEAEFFEDGSTPTKNVVIESTGETFASLPTVLTIESTLRYIRNENPSSTRFAKIWDDWLGSAGKKAYTNTDSFVIMGRTIPARRAVMWIADVSSAVEGTTNYYRVTFGFKFYSRTYADEIKVKAYGFLQKNGTKIEYIKEANGAPVRTAQGLDVSGVPVVWPAKPHEYTFKVPLDAIAFAPYQFT